MYNYINGCTPLFIGDYVIIQLKDDVKVRIPMGDFHTFLKNTWVNYSCKKDLHATHKFTAECSKGILVYLEVTQKHEVPKWL